MNATVTKPKAGYRLSRTELRRRWQQLASDPLVAAIPFKVELNEKGAIEVSPPTMNVWGAALNAAMTAAEARISKRPY